MGVGVAEGVAVAARTVLVRAKIVTAIKRMVLILRKEGFILF